MVKDDDCSCTGNTIKYCERKQIGRNRDTVCFRGNALNVVFIHSFDPFFTQTSMWECSKSPMLAESLSICHYLCIIWEHGNRCTVSSLCRLLKCFHYKLSCKPTENNLVYSASEGLWADSTGGMEAADRQQVGAEGLVLVNLLLRQELFIVLVYQCGWEKLI